MELCRICLQGKTKMFSLKDEPLKTCFEAVASSLDKEVGLPQTVCYICSRELQKCYSLIRRTQIAKSALLNIFSRYGLYSSFNNMKLSKENAIMKEINKAKTKLISKLKTIKLAKISVNGVIKHVRDDTLTGSYKITSSSNVTLKLNRDSIDFICEDLKLEEVYTRDFRINSVPSVKEELSDQVETDTDNLIDDTDTDVNQDSFLTPACESSSKVDDVFGGVEIGIDGVSDADDIPLSAVKVECLIQDSLIQERIRYPRRKKVKRKSYVNSEGLTQKEAELKQFFNIIVLSVEEQIADRIKMKEETTYRDALYRCEICYRTYLNPQAHQSHLNAHHESQGEWECRVCKLRFKSESIMRSHSDKSHGKKYCCKSCPKTFTKLELAAKHSKRHTGYVYKCSMCEYTAANKSSLKNHLRITHSIGGSVCTRCGQTFANIRGLKLHTIRLHHVRLSSDEQRESFECRTCEIQFQTEDALERHNEVPHPCPDNAICSTCGEEFPNQNQLNKHSKYVHGDDTKWGSTNETYPTKCEYCNFQVNNRKDHYFHVRKSHPKEREKYKAVITAVCVTCGKGFQNATKLHLHELRHKGVLSVSCPHCPRLFYDKFHLSRHISVHSDDRPFACAHCDKTFKLRSNLDRHAKAHSDVTAYECSLCNKRFRYSSSRNLHVKTVHHKIPQPPRKRKTAAKSNKPLDTFSVIQSLQ